MSLTKASKPLQIAESQSTTRPRTKKENLQDFLWKNTKNALDKGWEPRCDITEVCCVDSALTQDKPLNIFRGPTF